MLKNPQRYCMRDIYYFVDSITHDILIYKYISNSMQNQQAFNQGPLDELLKQQKQAASIKNQINQFTIVSQNSQKQTLQANLKAGQSFYYRGKVVYSDYTDQNLPVLNQKWFLQKWINRIPKMNYWVNKSNKYQIVGLTHPRHKGPLLILDLEVYEQSFYINEEYLLVSLKNIEDKKRDFHKLYGKLFLLQFKQKKESLQNFLQREEMVVLQANSPILEKYLGENQQFCIYESSNILAISEKITMQSIIQHRIPKDRGCPILKFKGPGWIFFETQTKNSSRMNGEKIVFIILIYLLVAGVLNNLI